MQRFSGLKAVPRFTASYVRGSPRRTIFARLIGFIIQDSVYSYDIA